MATGGTGRTTFTLETTEFHDILMRRGIISRGQALIAKGMSADEANALLLEEHLQLHSLDDVEFHETTAQREAAREATVARAVADEDDALLDELEDDLEDDGILNSYREKRLAELKAAAAQQRFGEVKEIRRSDWMREVNDASTDGPVVVSLYQDSVESTRVVDRVLGELAARHRDLKFVRIPSTDAVEGWPDANLPVLFIYRDGEMAQQLDADTLCAAQQLTTSSISRALQEAGVLPADQDAPDLLHRT